MRSIVTICVLATLAAAQDSRPTGRMSWTGVLGEKEFAALHELKEDETPELKGQMVDLGDSRAYLSLPESAKFHSAVLVIHEWWGLNEHIKHWADRLAADGYAALAVDLYGGAVATTPAEARRAMTAVDEEQALATLQAALQFLRDDERVHAEKRACIGWCFGGTWSLRLAMAAPDLDAAVMYYGRVVDDIEQLSAMRAPLLGVFGNLDPSIPPEAVDAFEAALQRAGKDAVIRRYDANHAFANPSSARYDSDHAAAAWAEVRPFLRRHLRPEERPTGQFEVGDRTVTYRVPDGWRPAAARPMRAVNFAVGEHTECYVSVLPGLAGGTEANLNRWRTQLGAEPLTDEEIAALKRVPILGAEGVLLQVAGTYRGMSGKAIEDAMLLGALCALEDQSVFVKMVGPEAEVAPQAQTFEAFCRALQ